jgi:hypothetical protein
MTRLLFPLFLFFTGLFFGQTQLKVLNKSNKQPIQMPTFIVMIICLGKPIRKEFYLLRQNVKKVEILANNFGDVVADVKGSMEVSMQPLSKKRENIERIIITDKSDPEH